MTTPDPETIRREGWDTPAAEYWQEMFNKLEQEEARLRIQLAALIEAAEVCGVAVDKYAKRPVDANDDPRSWHALHDLTRSVDALRAALARVRGGAA